MSKRILAQFVPQVWVGDIAMCVDPQGDDCFDVTAPILAMGRAKALALVDDDYETDALREYAPQWAREWSGPFYIAVAQAIEDYFWIVDE